MSCVTRFIILRGTTVERLAFTPLKGELVFDCDLNKVFVGDGTTAGGLELGDNVLTSLTLNSNTLTYTDENGIETDLDLTPYLDDTNLARLVNGTLDSNTGIATFERDDNSTFTVDFSSLIDVAPVTSVNGQTGIVVIDKNDVGLGNVDNTSDLDKPVSTATQTALDLKANQTDLDAEVTNRTSADTNLQNQINLNDTDISTLQTEQTTQNVAIALNTDKVSADGSVTSHNDVTDAGSGQIITTTERTKLDGIEDNAEVNVQADWNEVDNTNDAFIQNKPTIPDVSNFETTTQLNTRDTANRDRTNHTGTQLANTISDLNTAVQALETDTTLTIIGNTLRYVGEGGVNQDIDLSLYLDDTNAARITSGILAAGTGIITFTRDDSTTFTVDASELLDNQIASEVPVTPTGNISSNNVQAALEELQADIDAIPTAPVDSVNGETGAITDVAKTDEINTFTSRQEIGTNPLHDNAFDYSDAKLTIIENDNNGGNSPNGQKDILHLTREGISGQAFANKASLALGRYENSGTSSRSQLDIKLTDDSFNSHNEVMSLRSNGNIGLGVTAPTKTLDVNGEARIRTIPQATNVDFITVVDNDGCVEKISLDDFIELTQAPTISGSVISGQFISVIGYPVGKGPSSAHQWFLDGNAISGATSTTYLVESADEGKSVSLQLDGGLSSNILSNFYPLDITDLEYWFDPTSGITTNNGRVTAWENRGTISITATPTQATNGPFLDTVQGLPAVSTNGPNGVTANLNVNSTEGVTSTHSLVAISTSGPTVNGGWRTLIRDFNAGHPLLSNGNTTIGNYGAGGFTSVPSLTMGLNERLIISLKYNNSSGDLDIAKNGGPYSSANRPNKNASNGGGFWLGGSSTSSQSYGQMGDVFIKNGIMSDSDIKKLEGYVAHKYDNTDLLPVGHPYKTEAP